MSPIAWAGFVLAGAAGAVARYVVDAAVRRRVGLRGGAGVPWGTLLINTTGSLLLGLLVGLGLYHGLSSTPRTIIGTGFCGAYTTFSTLTFETVRLAQEGEQSAAVGTALGSLLAGSAAAALGLAIAAVL